MLQDYIKFLEELYNSIVWQKVDTAGVIILTCLTLAVVLHVVIYTYYYSVIISNKKKNTTIVEPETYPDISIIVCARYEYYNLQKFLPLLFEQDYKGNYEVVLVNDDENEGTQALLNEFSAKFPNLHCTFIPPKTNVISRKKLAITIAVKASKYDHLVFIDADCKPGSTHWLKSMARHFSSEKNIVLGFGGYFKRKSFLNRLIAFDTLTIALQYLGFAYRGAPYMGVGRNLAYRKDVFTNAKGFAGLLHLASGDDDLFINRAATGENTAVECTSIGSTYSAPKTTFKDWYHQKNRHLTTAWEYSNKTKLMLLLEPIAKLMFYVSLPFAIASLSNTIITVSAILFCIRFFVQMYVINKSAEELKNRKFYSSLLIFDWLLPLLTLLIMVFGNKKNINKDWR